MTSDRNRIRSIGATLRTGKGQAHATHRTLRQAWWPRGPRGPRRAARGTGGGRGPPQDRGDRPQPGGDHVPERRLHREPHLPFSYRDRSERRGRRGGAWRLRLFHRRSRRRRTLQFVGPMGQLDQRFCHQIRCLRRECGGAGLLRRPQSRRYFGGRGRRDLVPVRHRMGRSRRPRQRVGRRHRAGHGGEQQCRARRAADREERRRHGHRRDTQVRQGGILARCRRRSRHRHRGRRTSKPA